MAKELRAIDITQLPDVLRIAEEVRSTQQPRVLRRNSEDLAVVMPIAPFKSTRSTETEARIWSDVGVQDPMAVWANYDPKRVKAALKQSAGALTGVDQKALLKDIYEAREQDSPGRPS